MIKALVKYQLLFSGIYILIALLVATPHNGATVALGCFTIGLNLPILFWTWSRIFHKKSIALAVSVIVFKYAILGLIIYLVTSRPELDGASFLIGLTSIVPTMVLFTLRDAKNAETF